MNQDILDTICNEKVNSATIAATIDSRRGKILTGIMTLDMNMRPKDLALTVIRLADEYKRLSKFMESLGCVVAHTKLHEELKLMKNQIENSVDIRVCITDNDARQARITLLDTNHKECKKIDRFLKILKGTK